MRSLADRIRRLAEDRGVVSNRDVVGELGVSPATAHRLLHALVTAGALERQGRGRAAAYRLPTVRRRFQLAGLDEHRAWDAVAADIARVRALPSDAARSLAYAASEILNNAIDHSRGRAVVVETRFERGATVVTIRDDGIGVFRRLCEDFGFPTPQDAIVQLEKGKLTSDPARHSGEGLFFSSKAVTRFRLESGRIAWVVDNEVRDSAIAPGGSARGTTVVLEVAPDRMPRLEDVFATYTDPASLEFSRTRATIKLATLGSVLVSRSEAKRLVLRLTEFRHVTLDFSGVEVVGQGFCDEVFRVFAREHPEVVLEPVAMHDTVAFMVGRARAVARL